MMTKWLGLVAILLMPGVVWADQPATAMQFAAVMQNPGHRQLVLDTAKQSPAWTHGSCPSASFAQAPEVGVYVPIVFNKSGVPVAGAWREGIIATGCGASLTLNVMTQITAPATLATGYLLPGGTIADPVLQNYAQSVALKAAGGIPAGCNDGYVANTVFGGYEGPDSAAKTGPWKEIWTLDLCGPSRQVVLHFVPDSTGTTITADPPAP